MALARCPPLHNYSIPVGAASSASTDVNPYDWDITFVNYKDVIISGEEFHTMLSCVPGISETDWVNHIRIQNGCAW